MSMNPTAVARTLAPQTNDPTRGDTMKSRNAPLLACALAGAIAAAFAAVNIFGGFLVTQRMLAMYKKKQK